MPSLSPTTDFLLAKRFYKQVVTHLPQHLYPKTKEDAYEVQKEVVSHLMFHHQSAICGYKLACTNEAAMDAIGVDEPFTGNMLSHSTYGDNATLMASDFRIRIIELEFVFTMGQDVPVGTEPYTALTIEPFIDAFLPGIEVVTHQFEDLTQVGGHALIADNAIHGASILGPRNTDWRTSDLANHAVRLMVNGECFDEGSSQNVLGNPLNGVAWLANHLHRRGLELTAGQFVTTGTACHVYPAQAGDNIVADFGELGEVSMCFE